MRGMTLKTSCSIALLVVSTTLLASIHAEMFIVGGAINWRVDPSYNYTDWAASTKAKVGDSLEFTYDPERHDVRRVTADEYSACDEEKYTELWTSGDDIVVLDSSGTWYFICAKPGHCTAGQKFSITVAPADSPPSPSADSRSPPPPPPSPPPPLPSSASFLSPPLAGFITTLVLNFAVAAGL